MARFTAATYHPGIQVAEFISEDGRHLLRSGGTLPWRINNSGDLSSPVNSRGEPTPKKTKNYIGFARVPSKKTEAVYNFFIFPDYESGREQLEASLKRKYGGATIEELVRKYAPAVDNDSANYSKRLLKATGIASDKIVGELDQDELNSLADAIEKIEGYHNDSDSRRETWVPVSTVIATDGARPLVDEEIVLRVAGKEQTLKSNAVGQFPPIAHKRGSIEILHKQADGEVRSLGTLSGDNGKSYSLLTQVQRYFGRPGPDRPPASTIAGKVTCTYIVQPHDTLSAVAQKFKTSVLQIKKNNDMKRDAIFPGQRLGINGRASLGPEAVVPKRSALKVNLHAPETSAPSDATVTLAPKAAPPADVAAVLARSNEGDGKPLALIPPDPRRAPWMVYAVAEAKKFAGATEDKIEQTINYAVEVKTGQTTTIGSNHPWCAAFANWCLMQAGYPIDNEKFFDHVAAKGRAHGFYEVSGPRKILREEEIVVKDKKGREKTKTKLVYQPASIVRNPLFVKVDSPIYGAIAVVMSSNGKGHHVGFVYAKQNEKIVILLGGNQADQINFSPFSLNSKKDKLLFFVPAAYEKTAVTDAIHLVLTTADEVNKHFGIVKKEKVDPTR